MVNDDHCVVCGDYVPEGRQVCYFCEERIMKNGKAIDQNRYYSGSLPLLSFLYKGFDHIAKNVGNNLL